MDQATVVGIAAIIAGMRKGGAISEECLSLIFDELAIAVRQSPPQIAQPVENLSDTISRFTA